jgi:hypothetical protein
VEKLEEVVENREIKPLTAAEHIVELEKTDYCVSWTLRRLVPNGFLEW